MPFLTTCSLLSLFSVFSVSVNVITIITLKNSRMNKATVKVHPSKGHEGPEGEWKQTRYLLYRRTDGPQGLYGGCVKSLHHQDSIPGPSPSPPRSESLYGLLLYPEDDGATIGTYSPVDTVSHRRIPETFVPPLRERHMSPSDK